MQKRKLPQALVFDWLQQFESFDENIRVLTLRVFLYVGVHKEVVLNDIIRDLGLIQSVTQRALQRLTNGANTSSVGAGLGLLVRYPDPTESRRFLYKLSPKGREVFEQLNPQD